MNSAHAIGVFDSGIGGLSVLQQIRSELPQEHLFYVADSAHLPYGDKPAQFIEQRAVTLTQFLLERGAKAIVVACNTATAAAIAKLRTLHAIPLIGMEPAVKPALAMTKSGVVGVLATTSTLTSEKFGNLLERFGSGAEVIVQPCPGLVEQVEKAELASDQTRLLLEDYVVPLVQRGADTLVLGCTHYPFLSTLIKQVAGPTVTVIDTAHAVARELRRRLEQAQLLAPTDTVGTEQFWTSGPPHAAQPIIDRLWHRPVPVQSLPAAFAEQQTPAGSTSPLPA